MDYSGNRRFLALIAAMVIIALYITGLMVTGPSVNLWADIGAGVCLLAEAILIGIISDRISPGVHILGQLLFLTFVLTNPQSVRFSMYHITTVALIVACYYDIMFFASQSSLLNVMKCNLALSVASLCYAPCAWLYLAFIVLNIKYADDKGKYLFTSVISFAIPLLIIFAVTFLTKDADTALALPVNFWKKIVTIPKRVWASSILTLARALAVTVIGIISAFSALKGIERCSTLKYKAIVRIEILLPVLAVFTVLFSAGVPSALSPALLMPATILIEEIITNRKYGSAQKLATTIILLLILAERTVYFI